MTYPSGLLNKKTLFFTWDNQHFRNKVCLFKRPDGWYVICGVDQS